MFLAVHFDSFPFQSMSSSSSQENFGSMGFIQYTFVKKIYSIFCSFMPRLFSCTSCYFISGKYLCNCYYWYLCFANDQSYRENADDICHGHRISGDRDRILKFPNFLSQSAKVLIYLIPWFLLQSMTLIQT